MLCVIALTMLAASCSDDAERNIILDTSSFYQQDIRYDSGGDERIIDAVHHFADANGMDFLLARKSLPPGDFNVTAASHDLNLKVMHSSPIDRPWHAVIYATSRGKPTNVDQTRLREFVNAIQLSASAQTLDAQPITYMDIEAAKLSGPSCNYAAGKSMAAVVIAMDDSAVMKIGGELKRFTLDPRCDKLEKGTGSRYVAPGYVLDLAVKKESRSEQAGKIGFQGSVKLSDGKGRVLYSTAGDVQCGG
jgi:hypothetical protein